MIDIVIMLVVIGLLLWIVGQLPIDATIKKIIWVVVIVGVCLWLLSMFGGYLPEGRFPMHIRR